MFILPLYYEKERITEWYHRKLGSSKARTGNKIDAANRRS
jgi:hypothetical protein